jgi:predicted PhzF superfamily epimerase YddE/YHI9
VVSGQDLGADPRGCVHRRKETFVQLDKNMILDLLRERGQQDQASQAEQELPDQVDTDQHANLLQKFGLDPQDLVQKFMGGGGLPKF